MREIKFRAWATQEEKMYYDVFFDNLEVTRIDDKNEFELIGDVYPDGVMPQAILMQYTGLHDKTGQEIYEGDRVAISFFGEGFEKADIKWNDKRCGYECAGYSLGVHGLEILTIIGNIYEDK